jgi:hypothetical protein
MNTSIINNTKTETLPLLPELKSNKTGVVVTKHFANLSLWLSPEEFRLFCYLLYNMSADNTITYSTILLRKHGGAIISARREYCPGDVPIKSSLVYIRKSFVGLIKKGVILTTPWRNIFFACPMFVYNGGVIGTKQFRQMQRLYQGLSAEDTNIFIKQYTEYVKEFLSAKKKDYVYKEGRTRKHH